MKITVQKVSVVFSKLLLLGVVGAVVGLALVTSYNYGYNVGASDTYTQAQKKLEEILATNQLQVSSEQKIVENKTQVTSAPQKQETYTPPSWSGPELWDAVNIKRVALGVNPLSSKSELCTIASIRLNELLELGKLDGHEGFSNLPDRREDLRWIFEKYNISEFLVSGAQSAEGAVSLWENTLGHKKLLDGGEYVWGCTYAQNGFGVAIAAY